MSRSLAPAFLRTTGPDMPLGWIVAGASGVSCLGCTAALFLDPESVTLWPLEIAQFIRQHASCSWPPPFAFSGAAAELRAKSMGK